MLGSITHGHKHRNKKELQRVPFSAGIQERLRNGNDAVRWGNFPSTGGNREGGSRTLTIGRTKGGKAGRDNRWGAVFRKIAYLPSCWLKKERRAWEKNVS